MKIDQSLKKSLLVFFGTFLLLIIVGGVGMFNKKSADNKQPPVMSSEEADKLFAELEAREDLETATFAGGCFWCMEGPFEQIDGVEEVISGYTGGTDNDPTYQEVASGQAGARESVRIYFDPTKTNFEELLNTYWYQIDPTDAEGQFADRGLQYTAAIFYHDQEQKAAAENSKASLDASGRYNKPVVTEILPEPKFFPAEDYHQDFYKHSAERYKIYNKLSGRENFVQENLEKAQQDQN